MKVLIMAMCFGVLASTVSSAAERPTQILGRDIVKTVSAPAHFDSRDWLTAGIIAGGAFALYSVDGQARDMFQRNRGATTNTVENIVKSAGRIETAVPAFVLLYGGAKYFGNEKLAKVSAMSIESFLISGLIFQSAKYLTHRDRPYENTSPYKWHGPGIYDAHQSFPSGDAATAFAMLTPVAYAYKDTPLVAPLCYSVAGLAALGRMNHNDHWASDVFVGSALGYFTARAVIKYHGTGGVAVLPIIDGQSNGVMFAGRF